MGLLVLLLGLGACYACRWVQGCRMDGVTSSFLSFPPTYSHIPLSLPMPPSLPFLLLLHIWESLPESSLTPSCCHFFSPYLYPVCMKEGLERKRDKVSHSPQCSPLQ